VTNINLNLAVGFKVPEIFDDLLGKFRIMSYVEKARNVITLGLSKKLGDEYSRANKKIRHAIRPYIR
jgi:hypothetical protein